MALVTYRNVVARRQACLTPFALAGALMLGACSSQLGDATGGNLTALKPEAQADGRSELVKATEYWGQQHVKNPADLTAALNYAKNLRAMGEKQRALAIMQQQSMLHSTSRELASEYGRLALELDQVGVAARLLTVADDPVKPDWRVVSARGTVLAKQGKYGDAIPFYERALALAPDQPSLLSNLALAHAMNGDAARAETMLRQAAVSDRSSLKIRQNLALVLGLQGKYDEAKLVASSDLSHENATENANTLRKIVKLPPANATPKPQVKPAAEPATDAPAAEPAAPVLEAPAVAELPPVVPPLPVAKSTVVPPAPAPVPATAPTRLPFSFEVAQWATTTKVTRARAPAPKMIAAAQPAAAGKLRPGNVMSAGRAGAGAAKPKALAAKVTAAESPLEIMLAAARELAAKASDTVEHDIKLASAIAMPTRNPARKRKTLVRKPTEKQVASNEPAKRKTASAKALASAMARGARVAARAAAAEDKPTQIAHAKADWSDAVVTIARDGFAIDDAPSAQLAAVKVGDVPAPVPAKRPPSR